jgi:hypothetical protein
MRVKMHEAAETKLTLKKRTVTAISPFQKSQAHPSQVLIFRTLLRGGAQPNQFKFAIFQNVKLST